MPPWSDMEINQRKSTVTMIIVNALNTRHRGSVEGVQRQKDKVS